MGGHSHWAGIKHKKALTDAKKGKVYTKLIREITIAAKLGGGDPSSNARLRKAIEDSKAANMPSDNVKRAVMKGTGQLPGAIFEELMYEGFGPAKTAIMVEVTTDNKNRTFSEIRKIFENNGGTMGTSGSVAFMFSQKGYITIKKSVIAEDELMNTALDAGAEDIQSPEGEDYYEVFTAPADFEKVKAALDAKKLALESSEVTMLPTMYVNIDDPKQAQQIVKLMDALEEHDDTKNIYSNFDIPDDVLAKAE